MTKAEMIEHLNGECTNEKIYALEDLQHSIKTLQKKYELLKSADGIDEFQDCMTEIESAAGYLATKMKCRSENADKYSKIIHTLNVID